MKIKILFISFFYSIIFLNTSVFNQDSLIVKDYPNPQRFENEIIKFEKADSIKYPPMNAIVCYGSSSMRGWHDSINVDLAPLTLIPRGFSGSNMNDALYFAARVVLNYKPRAILLYEGDNDIDAGITPDKILETFNSLKEEINKSIPDCRIYVLAIKPSLSRWHIWPEMQIANNLLREACEKDEKLFFIDITSKMLKDDGSPKEDIFLADSLHMNRKGYIIWRDVVRPILVENEKKYEN